MLALASAITSRFAAATVGGSAAAFALISKVSTGAWDAAVAGFCVALVSKHGFVGSAMGAR